MNAFAANLSGLRGRILAGTGANLFGQAVSALVQLVSLPLFLHAWDAARYGKWVMLSAIPTYFAMSDGGIVPVAGNRITILRAAGDTVGADRVFQSAFALVLAATLIVTSLFGAAMLLLPRSLLDSDGAAALWVLVLTTMIGFFGGLFDAGFRAYGRYAQGILLNNVVRILELLGLGAGLGFGGRFTSVALGLLAARLAGTLWIARYCQRNFTDLRWSLKKASSQEIRSLIRPGVAYLAFPLGNGLSIQAVTLIVGSYFGPIVLATFNTYRTLSRLVLQAAATFSHAIGAEFSRVYGSGNVEALWSMYKKSALAGAAISAAAALAMIPAAPIILSVWTQGKIGFDAQLYVLFAVVTLIGGLAHVPRVFLQSINRHTRLGFSYLIVSALCLLVVFCAANWSGPNGTVAAMGLQEGAILYLSVAISSRLFHGLRACEPSAISSRA